MLVEARLSWGGSVLAVSHTPVRDGLRVGDLDLPIADAQVREVVVIRGGELVSPRGGSQPKGAPVELAVDGATLRVSLVRDDAPRIARASGDGRVAKGVALGAVLHVALLAAAILGRA